MFGFNKKKTVENEPSEYTPYEVVEDGEEKEVENSQSSVPAQTNNSSSDLDINKFGENAAQQIDTSLSVFNNVTSSIKECYLASKNVELEIAKMDHQLDAFIADSNNKLDRFKTAMPVLEKQLNKVSDRIDKITDQMLENVMSLDNPESIKKHEMMIDMLNKSSDSFNNLLVKLIGL